MFLFSRPASLPGPDEALPDRADSMQVTNRHFVNGNPIKGPFPDHLVSAVFGMGCFWGAERKFWQLDGVYTTAVGYAGGLTRNASYRDACSGMSGHAEVALVVFDPAKISYSDLLTVFWESHDPTQGMRQGNDQGTQYRSAIYAYGDEQLAQARASRESYQENLDKAGLSQITTEIKASPDFFYAEDDHQQYLAKNPQGYCGIGGTGVVCGPVPAKAGIL
jgi:peptide-methionine (S)-S-oxide reductase